MANRPEKIRTSRKKLTSAQLRKKYKFVVKVPKPPARAYDPKRAVSGLVAHQIQHLQLVEQGLPARHRVGTSADGIKTEGGAAAFVGHVTDALHQINPGAVVSKSRKPRRNGPSSRRKKNIRPRSKSRRGHA